ncbi:MAG: MFS transporter [Firmicutes bacterium]|nr:MFS transporter [Bacillota bacterium]
MKNGSSSSLWTLSYKLSLVSIVCACVSMTFFIPLFAFYLPEIGEPAVKVGLVISTFAVTAILTRPIFAFLIDSGKGRNVLFFGYICIITAIAGYRFTSSVVNLLPVRVIHGMGYAAVTNSAINVFTKDLKGEVRKMGLAYFGLAMVFANSLGPSVGLTFRNLFGTRNAFFFALAIASLGIICLVFSRPGKEDTLSSSRRFSYLDGYEFSAMPLAALMVLACIANAAIVTYLGKYVSELGYPSLGTAFFLIYALAMIAARKVVDILLKKIGDYNVLYLAYAITAVSYLLISIAKTPVIFCVAAVCYGISFGTIQPTLNALILTICPPEKRGAANSTFQTSLDTGAAIGAIIWGYVTEICTYPQIYLLSIVTSAIALIGLKYYTSKHKTLL